MYDVIVVGAGVSGLFVSGRLAQRGVKVLLLEKMEKPARKLRITGKGRCNITNTADVDGHLSKVKVNPDFVSCALYEFDSQGVISFLNQIGVPTKVERGGRVFPESDSAVEVALAMVRWCESVGVEIRCHAKVETVMPVDGGFEVECNGLIKAENVVIATGGASYPSTGSDGDGYMFAFDLGHNIVPVRPSLVALKIDDLKPLIGLQLRNVQANLVINDEIIDGRFGDVDFTSSGIAGAAILQLSRLAVDAIVEKNRVAVQVDLKPALSIEKLKGRLNRECETLQSATLKILLQKLIPSQLHARFVNELGMTLNKPIKSLLDRDLEQIIGLLKRFVFAVRDYGSFSEAIVTAGGVDVCQVDEKTMMSKIVDHLYFCGEVLDVDSDTGGYNIQLALSTAQLVVNSIKK